MKENFTSRTDEGGGEALWEYAEYVLYSTKNDYLRPRKRKRQPEVCPRF